MVVRRPVPARKESAATAARLSCPKDLNPALAQPVVRVVEGPRERCGTWLGNIPLLAMAAQVWSRWRDSRGIAAVGIFFGNLLAIRLLGLLAEWLDKS